MDVGAKIRNARIRKRMTQDQLGELVGLKKSAIAKYENGRIVNIKRSTLQKISAVLDIPPVELVFQDESYGKSIDEEGLSRNTKMLIDYVKSVPEDKAELVLRVMKSIVEAD